MIEPVRIEPEALYDDGALRQALGLTAATLAAARRAGSLRYTRQGKRTLYKGAWVSAWLETAAATASEARQAAQCREVGQEHTGDGEPVPRNVRHVRTILEELAGKEESASSRKLAKGLQSYLAGKLTDTQMVDLWRKLLT
jgi:hypothetical protein